MCLVSIITPTYNSANFIEDTYKSVMGQTLSDWNWIVTDDGSTDDTINILNKISSSDHRVQINRNINNLGAAYSRNKSLSIATGKFVAFLDSDDLWKKDKLEKQVEFMNDKKKNFSFTGYELLNEKGSKLNITVDTTHHNNVFNYNDLLLKKVTLGCSTVMLRNKFINGIQMPLLRTGQDYAFWLLLLRNGGVANLLNSPLTEYRIRPNSISRNKIRKAFRQWEIYRKHERISFFMSLIYFSSYAFHALYRRP